MILTHGSLFAGIGGFDLGFERAGIKTIWQVEIDAYCRRVLAKHFPHARRFEDVRRCGADNLARVDILSGGFPCQDISNAGKRAGIDGERSGLWSEYARIIRELRPRFVVVENVAALLHRGIERVLGDLAACGYDAEWQSIRASDVGAPHRRDRIWIVAYSSRERWAGSLFSQSDLELDGLQSAQLRATVPNATGVRGAAIFGDESNGVLSPVLADIASPRCDGGQGEEQFIFGRSLLPARSGGCRDVADANGRRQPVQGQSSRRDRFTACGGETVPDSNGERREERWRSLSVFETHARVEYAGEELRSGWWAVEPDVGRVAHGIPCRVDRLRGLGNAIVPQIAEFIGKKIIEAAQNE